MNPGHSPFFLHVVQIISCLLEHVVFRNPNVVSYSSRLLRYFGYNNLYRHSLV